LPSLSQAGEEVVTRVEGCAIREARDARASGLIYKVECPLRSNFEYMLRRVDRHHPRRPIDFILEEIKVILESPLTVMVMHPTLYIWLRGCQVILLGVT
jgi:hypothetical protein